MQRIVVIGGGTGVYTALMGLKHYSLDLTAIVSMMDSGGSTGKLRDEFGFLPPGDVRRCLLALSNETTLLRKVFDYRFTKGGLKGHNLGNLFLTALRDTTGSEEKSIMEASKILNVRGSVVPVTLQNTHLGAILENGQVIVGETNIDIPKHDPDLRIRKLFIVPKARAYRKALEKIAAANKIVIGPGDLFTSVISNLLVKGIKEAIRKSKAKIIYVCNIMTKHGETTGFNASDFVHEIEEYLGRGAIDFVLCNDKRPAEELLKRYEHEEAHFVEPDITSRQFKVINADFLSRKDLARHDPDKLAGVIMGL